MTRKYRRTPEELKERASLFWPKELTGQEASSSVLPLLLETQDHFLSLLCVADAGPDAWKDALKTTGTLKPSIFLKHLMVLTDVGGELLKRLSPQMKSFFANGEMEYVWQGKYYRYKFRASLNSPKFSNKTLFIDSEGLLAERELDARMEDVAMLLLHGASVTNATLPEFIQEKCIIGGLIGQKEALERFIKQRYIVVSRIVGGATSNRLGQIAQDYVKERIAQALPDWQIRRNGTISGISQNEGITDIGFDIVALSPTGKSIAVEISFQVTTNSVVERKAGQAQARAKSLHQKGHKIAYVIDGAGNFERKSALRTICRYSDCTVAFTPEEIDLLIDFLRKNG